MNALLESSLDRTFLLMRDELHDEVTNAALLDALTGVDVVLAADIENVSSHAAQSAFVTAALLMGRSGHHVYLAAPDVPLIGLQPPLKGGTLISSLMEIGCDLLPGVEFSVTPPAHAVDLCAVFGDSRPVGDARRVVSLNASAWSSYLRPLALATRWRERGWPFGAMGAGALAAGEAFKVAMHGLRRFARAPENFDKLFAPTLDIRFDLAPPEARRTTALGAFDFVSGGAIAHASLFCLGRIPCVTGEGRIIEGSTSEHSNLNRYALLLRSDVSTSKVDTLLGIDFGSLRLHAVPARLDDASAAALAPLAHHVLVGVDHIPTRWFVQRLHPRWLGIGATTHWGAMASFHEGELACAWCLHPRDDPADMPIPTVAFVSFWAGLLLAVHFVRSAGGDFRSPREQQVYLTPVRPESVWWTPVAARRECPVCGFSERAA